MLNRYCILLLLRIVDGNDGEVVHQGSISFPQHLRVDGSWLRRCNASRLLWRGLAVRDLKQGSGRKHDLVTFISKYNLLFLYVPKVASSSGRAYAKKLDNASIEAISWNEAIQKKKETKTITFSLTRDPLERFVSASGTLAHRTRGDAWDTKGLKLVKECVSRSQEFALNKKIGKYSYAAAAQHARCSLAMAEENGLFWNHHLAPQLSYYAVLNDNTTLVHGSRVISAASLQSQSPKKKKKLNGNVIHLQKMLLVDRLDVYTNHRLFMQCPCVIFILVLH